MTPSSPTRWRDLVPQCRQLVMWGGGDQGRVNRPILDSLGCELAAVIDDTPGLTSPFAGVPLLAGWDGFTRWHADWSGGRLGFVVAIGNPYGHVRLRLHERLATTGLEPASFADATSLLCRSATLGPGLQVMAHAIVHNDAVIGRQCILNTRCLVEHDCVLGDGVEVGPGAVLCGRVRVGAHSWIGAGATIRPRVTIGRNAIVGAGSVVVTDIPDGVVAVGVPARPLPGRSTVSADAEKS